MKILVSGDGGMLYVKDMEIAQRAEHLLYLGLVSESGLEKTVDWYLANKTWWEPILKNSYSGERLGKL